MRHLHRSATRAIRKSKELVRAVKVDMEATGRQLEATRALVDSYRELLRTMRTADRIDVPQNNKV
jgi:hypothetical protein